MSHSFIWNREVTAGEQFPFASEELAVRLISHVMVDQMPARALPELLDSLGRIQEFYQTPERGYGLLPAPAIAAPIRPNVAAPRIQAPFQIDEE